MNDEGILWKIKGSKQAARVVAFPAGFLCDLGGYILSYRVSLLYRRRGGERNHMADCFISFCFISTSWTRLTSLLPFLSEVLVGFMITFRQSFNSITVS